MILFNQRYFCITLAFVITTVRPLFSQIPDFSKVPILEEGDSLNIIYLVNNGIKISDRKVIAWFPKDSLSEKKMREITGTINAGIAGAEKVINAPYRGRHSNQMNLTLFIFDQTGSYPMLPVPAIYLFRSGVSKRVNRPGCTK